MSIYIQMLGGGDSTGPGAALLVSCNGRRYLFNPSQGVTRQMLDYDARFEAIDCLMAVNSSPDSNESLFSMLISRSLIYTFCHIPTRTIKLFGSPTFSSALAAYKTIARLKYDYTEFGVNKLITTSFPGFNLYAYTIILQNTTSVKQAGLQSQGTIYILEPHASKIDEKLAGKSGLKMHSHEYKKLEEGHSIFTNNNQLIHRADVSIRDDNGQVFVVLPNVESAVNVAVIETAAKDPSLMPLFSRANTVFHFSTWNIITDAAYGAAIQRIFGTYVHQIALNKGMEMNNWTNLRKAAETQDIANRVMPDCMPAAFRGSQFPANPYFSTYGPQSWIEMDAACKTATVHPVNVVYTGLTNDQMSKIDLMMGVTMYPRRMINKKVHYGDFTPTWITLGTSFTIPSKYRSSPGHLLKITPNSSILVECGDSMIIQLRSQCQSLEDFCILLSSIRLIILTTAEIDHVAGLGTLLQCIGLMPDAKQPIVLCTPDMKALGDFLPTYIKTDEANPLNITYIDKYLMPDNIRTTPITFPGTDFSSTKFTLGRIRATDKNFALTIDIPGTGAQNVNRIGYKGHTDPGLFLLDMFTNPSPVTLIHEATYASSDYAVAKQQYLSTTLDAIAYCKAVKATNLIITAFDIKYGREPNFNLEMERIQIPGQPEIDLIETEQNYIICAMDGMRIPILDPSMYLGLWIPLTNVLAETYADYNLKYSNVPPWTGLHNH